MRVQDVSGGVQWLVSDNTVYDNIESGIYLAAGSYTGADGSHDVTVANNTVS